MCDAFHNFSLVDAKNSLAQSRSNWHFILVSHYIELMQKKEKEREREDERERTEEGLNRKLRQ